MFAEKKGFPDMEKDRVGWNKAWEHEIDRFSTFVYTVDAANILHQYPSEDADIATHRSTIRSLCYLQRDLTVLVHQRFTVDNLELDWMGRMSVSDRQGHLLEGMVRACRNPTHYGERLHCDEIILPYLQKENGRGFLDLLRSFTISDTTTIPSEPIYLSNTRFDRMLRPGPGGQSEQQVFFRADMTLKRNWFICHFLTSTLGSIYNQAEKPIVFVKGPGPKLTRAERKNMPEARKAQREAAKDNTIICCENLGCQIRENVRDSGVRFMMCSNCSSKMQRRIFYCSKQCQKVDWKARHKAICGKPLTLQDAQASAIGDEPPKQTWNTGQEAIRNALFEIPWVTDIIKEHKSEGKMVNTKRK